MDGWKGSWVLLQPRGKQLTRAQSPSPMKRCRLQRRKRREWASGLVTPWAVCQNKDGHAFICLLFPCTISTAPLHFPCNISSLSHHSLTLHFHFFCIFYYLTLILMDLSLAHYRSLSSVISSLPLSLSPPPALLRPWGTI